MAENMLQLNNSINIPRAHHSLTNEELFSMEVGKIYPIDVQITTPNELTEINIQNVIRQMATRRPSMSNFRLQTRTFAVAIRNVWKDIGQFLTGFKEYSTATKFEEPVPVWKPSKPSVTQKGELWDCLGHPVNTYPDEENMPDKWTLDAYNYIWDVYFRDETKQESILKDGVPNSSTNEYLLRIGFDRDYFTSVLPFQQLGDPVGIPVTGETQAKWEEEKLTELKKIVTDLYGGDYQGVGLVGFQPTAKLVESKDGKVISTGRVGLSLEDANAISNQLNMARDEKANSLLKVLNDNIVSMKNISSVLISDLRMAFAIQLSAEMKARGGVRIDEHLLANYGTAPTDESLQRPIYLGGSSTSILTSEVLQTSQTSDTEPLGQMGGHGLGAGQSEIIRYHSKEPCILMTVAYIKPNTLYMNTAVQKEFNIKTLYDYPTPVFGHLSEQAVKLSELCCLSTKAIKKDSDEWEEFTDVMVKQEAEEYNNKIAGYLPIYQYKRERVSRVHGLLAVDQIPRADGTYEHNYNLYEWTEARFFDKNKDKRPLINEDFIKVNLDNRNYSVIDDVTERAQFIVWFRKNVNSWSTVDKYGNPGRIDHII